ncbi:M20/M25/M40 family metallo-hydrolase [Streptomyces sp. M10(2022)]
MEQGRALDLSGDPVGVASAIWPHGRWRFDFRGEANHAGTTRLADRRDPMLTYAETVLAARREAEAAGVSPPSARSLSSPTGSTPSLPRTRLARLPRRRPGHPGRRRHRDRAGGQGPCRAGGDRPRCRTGVLHARRGVPARPARRALPGAGEARRRRRGRTVPVLGTGAGHDAGILSASVPTAMLFVRNPTGISHSPAEHAAEDDCVAGVMALADVLEGLACS